MTPEVRVAALGKLAAQVRAGLRSAPSGRGGRVLEYGEHKLDRIEELLATVQRGISMSDEDPVLTALLEQATRQQIRAVADDLDQLATFVATHRDAVGRSDIPVGLMDLIHSLIADLLERAPINLSVDPLISLSPRPTYEVTCVGVSDAGLTLPPPLPVIFELPALDAHNVLMAPLIAHEAAHVVEELQPLEDAPDDANAKIREIFAEVPVAGPPEDAQRSRASMVTAWTSEVFCDLFAARLCGPSYVLALLTHLPSTEHSSGSHPPAGARLRWVLDYLLNLGWRDFIAEHLPEVSVEMSTGEPVSFASTAEQIALVRAVQVLIPHLEGDLAQRCDPLAPLDPTAFTEAVELLNASVPPVEVHVGATDSLLPLEPWHAVTAGWIQALATEPRNLLGILEASSNVAINNLVLKTVELSRVVTLWKAA